MFAPFMLSRRVSIEPLSPRARPESLKLLFTNFHDGDGGGHTTYILRLAEALAARHEVHVAAPPGSRLLREAGCLPGVHAIGQPFPNGFQRLASRWRARRRLAAWLRAHPVDVVHVNGSADHRLVMAARHGMARPPKIVLTKHNSKPMTGIGHRWRARCGTDRVIAVCDYTRRALMTSPYRRCRPVTVHNGVDLAHFSPWPATSAQREREHWLRGASGLLLGSNAGSAAYKGWQDLVEAVALLPLPQRERVHLLIAGQPPSPAAQQRIDALGLASQVHFPGLLQDVRPAIAGIDAGFVLSWDVETISFACREMMAMGKPVLVTDYAGLPENIRPGVDGWCVPPRDPARLAQQLEQLLQLQAQLPAMGAAARRHAERDFGLPRFVERTEAVYRELLAGD